MGLAVSLIFGLYVGDCYFQHHRARHLCVAWRNFRDAVGGRRWPYIRGPFVIEGALLVLSARF